MASLGEKSEHDHSEDAGYGDENGGSPITMDDVLIHYKWNAPHLLKLNLAIFFITLSSTNLGYDGSMLNGLQSLKAWSHYMGDPQGAKLGALSNGAIFGSLLGVSIASWISDRYGRVWGILIGETVTIVGAILQGLSTNYAFFFCARMVLGVGVTIAGVASPSLISEIAYPTQRSIATAMYNVCWYLGAVIAAAVTYGTRNLTVHNTSWRIPSYIQGALPLIQICGVMLMPESPRFLVSRGELEKAREVLQKYHVGGDMSAEAQNLIDFEISEIETAIEMEKIQNTSKYTDFFKTPGNRKRLMITCFVPFMMQLSGNGLVSYYLNKVLNSIGITDTDEQLKINVALMAYNLAMSGVAAGLTFRVKRRQMFLISLTAMCLCYVIWTILSAINQQRNFEDKALGQGVLAMIFFFYLSYDFGLNGLPYLYLTEVLSYSLRAKGVNIMTMISQFCSIFSGFVNPVAINIQWKYYIVYCCILACEIPVVYFFFPETSGYSLEEVGEIFGDDPRDVHNVVSVVISGKRSVVQHISHV